MSSHRFYVPFQMTDTLALLDDPDEFGHLLRVLRLKKGDGVELVNGQGAWAEAVVGDIHKASAQIIIQRVSSFPAFTGPKITLACAIPKKAKFETIIEKCTELGVDRIVPLLTGRSDVLMAADRAEKKAGRFNRVVVNAAKQSRRLWFPEVDVPTPFVKAVEMLSGPGKALFIPWLEGKRALLAEAFAQKGQVREVVFFIGPEGDFTPDEAALAIKAGAVPVTLGENILKVETAAIAVVAFFSLMERCQDG